MQRLLCILLAPVWLAGCDQLSERAGFPNAAKVEAEGKAIGAACRHAGRGLEDCYRLNKNASKAAVFAGWKEMNEYMQKNAMPTMEPSVGPHAAKPAEAATEEKGAAKPAEPTLKPATKAETDKPAAPAVAK